MTMWWAMVWDGPYEPNYRLLLLGVSTVVVSGCYCGGGCIDRWFVAGDTCDDRWPYQSNGSVNWLLVLCGGEGMCTSWCVVWVSVWAKVKIYSSCSFIQRCKKCWSFGSINSGWVICLPFCVSFWNKLFNTWLVVLNMFLFRLAFMDCWLINHFLDGL